MAFEVKPPSRPHELDGFRPFMYRRGTSLDLTYGGGTSLDRCEERKTLSASQGPISPPMPPSEGSPSSVLHVASSPFRTSLGSQSRSDSRSRARSRSQSRQSDRLSPAPPFLSERPSSPVSLRLKQRMDLDKQRRDCEKQSEAETMGSLRFLTGAGFDQRISVSPYSKRRRSVSVTLPY